MAYAKVTAHPPLGQLTVTPAEEEDTCFTVLVDWNRTRPHWSFEVSLCYTPSSNASKHTSTWPTVPMKAVPNPALIEQKDSYRSSFQVKLPTNTLTSGTESTVQFTIKYRINDIAPWQWVQTEQGTPPGTLLVATNDSGSTADLSNFLTLESGWTSTKVESSQHTSPVYELQSQQSVPKSNANHDEEKLSAHTLGTIPGLLRYMALIRLESYWLGPRQGRDYFYLAEDAILCAFLTLTGQVVTIITMTGLDDTYSVMQSGEDGKIVIAARCDSDESVPFRAIVSIASTFDESCSAVMKHATTVANSQPLAKDIASRITTSPDSETRIDDWLDSLVFCTWNALGQDLTQNKILSALSSLSKNNINISALLIDDNWQTLGPIPEQDYTDSFRRGFASIPANTSVAPEGLQTLISKIKSAHPTITDIGVWHALMGYWGGFSPTGEIARTYTTTQIPSYLMNHIPATMTSISPEDLHTFYNDFYTYLSGSGVTFIKTDVQHMPSMFRSRSARRSLTSPYQSAWTTASTTHFHGKAISCMAQTPQNLFASLLQTHSPRILHRNSDDFFPEIPRSHPWHIWTNAHNALFTRHLNVTPDWDMFQTSHVYSGYHAAARCISGGPLTITDVPGEHDLGLISRMTALDARGRSVALRTGVAAAVRVFDEYREGRILKVGSVTRDTKGGGGWKASLLGLWNIAEREETTLVSVGEFPEIKGLSGTGKVVVGSYQGGRFFGPIETTSSLNSEGSSSGLVYITLPVREWDVLTAYPVIQPLPGRRDDIELAVVGLTDKISGAAGVIDVKVHAGSDSGKAEVAKIEVDLRALGKLGVCIMGAAGSKVGVGNIVVSLQGETVSHEHRELKDEETAGMKILYVDVEGEWRRRDLFRSDEKAITVGVEISL